MGVYLEWERNEGRGQRNSQMLKIDVLPLCSFLFNERGVEKESSYSGEIRSENYWHCLSYIIKNVVFSNVISIKMLTNIVILVC